MAETLTFPLQHSRVKNNLFLKDDLLSTQSQTSQHSSLLYKLNQNSLAR